ncbi:SMI1/KNR4 family protein [Dactylosporangium sucinum]|uniref:Knr4/Smi1-like domain-containing protein n=1 Tax=Dactylosporangium sucinum TaxID=1424081 RepID=A0A917U681_9ACTN|nr:SMI1/KNR4 family protein [Dactylosporangium sucinum]GGM55924.1 hypothetical protein GCM10007977_066990 [Dactylosporangium sucinum]
MPVTDLARLVDGTLQVLCHNGGLAFFAYDEHWRRRVGSGSARGLVDALWEYEEAMRPPGEARPLVVEVLGGVVSHAFELDGLAPVRVALDPQYRHPNHPAPGMPRPPGTAVADRPTDPAVLAEVRGLVGAFVERPGGPSHLGEGCSEADLLAAETAMGLRLPEEVRALYRTVRADPREQGLLGAQSLLPLDEVVAEYLAGEPGSYGWNDGVFGVEPVVFESYPPGVVRRVSRSDWWVTIASDNGGDWCAVDLDPAPGGRPGQLVEYGRNIVGPVGYVADGVLTLLRHGGGRSPDSPHCEVVTAVADARDPQQLYLNDAGDVDLAALARLRNLRQLSINRAGRVCGSLAHAVPLEFLSITADSVDVRALAGHPTLWKLTLRGLRHPVPAEALAALPALAHLDVAGVEVDGLEQLAALPGLRVLEASRAQWQRLDTVPPRLAAAAVTDPMPLAEALEWAARLRG